MLKGKPVRYSYQTGLKWMEEKKGVITAEGKPDINIACPPEFGGHSGIWSPEDLFLSSVEVCTMTTFLWLVNKKHIQLKSYESKASGFAELVDNVFHFQSIKIHMKVGISSEEDRIKIEQVIENIPKFCVVSNSIYPPVDFDVDIFLDL